MAKSKSFFGLRTGSTKSLTFQVYKGQQITKDRVTRISNPRSEAQMRQRAIIPIVAASRAALKGLVDHSFEGVAYGDQSLKKFSELNLRAGAIDVESYSPNGVSNPGFASLIVAKGSLFNGFVDCRRNADSTAAQFHFPVPNAKTDLKFKAAAVGDDADEELTAIAEWGATEFEVVAPGNQLTFLTVSQVGSIDVGENSAALSEFDINRILFPSSANTPAQVEDVNGAWKVQSAVTEGANTVTLYNKNTMLTITWNKASKSLVFEVQPTNHLQGTVAGGALIRSAYVNGAWKRSNAQITFDGDIDPRYTYEMWRSYYESTGSSAKYLNQGKEGTGIG